MYLKLIKILILINIIFTKKTETDKKVFLICNKGGIKVDKCYGKAIFVKNKGKIVVYNKCNENNNIHTKIGFDNFKKLYYLEQYHNIDMNLNYTKNIILNAFFR